MMYKRERPCYTPRRKTPSFSSSMLEAIYRSIDESEGRDLCSALYDKGFAATARKQSSRRDYERNAANAPSMAHRRMFSSLERVVMIEDWKEKQGSGVGGSSSSWLNSGSLSSGSSSGGMMGAHSFLFSETESGRRKHESEHKSRLPDYEELKKKKKKDQNEDFRGRFLRTKLRIQKIYDELKKVKEPMSPGGKISAFLNSIFNSRNVKKAKMCYVGAVDDISSFERKAALSSVSSSSRPCMIKTPSARNFSTNDSGTKQPKRSVKLYPSQVFLDDNSEPHGCQAVLRRCSSCKEKDSAVNRASSCSSSDLFELHDHLMGRLGEESPVYETTATTFKRNQAIIAHPVVLSSIIGLYLINHRLN